MTKQILIHSFAPQDRSGRIRWLLEEMGLPYTDKFWDGKKGEHKTEEFLKINPMGAMPAIEWNGHAIAESAGIILAITDQYAEKGFAPALDSPDRFYYYQWVTFAPATLEVAIMPYWAVWQGTDEQKAAALAQIRKEKAPEIVATLEKRLKNHEFLVGNSLTTADISVASSLKYGEGVFLENSPILKAYWTRMSERPAAIRAKLFAN